MMGILRPGAWTMIQVSSSTLQVGCPQIAHRGTSEVILLCAMFSILIYPKLFLFPVVIFLVFVCLDCLDCTFWVYHLDGRCIQGLFLCRKVSMG